MGRLTIRWRFRVVVMACVLPFLAYIVWSATEQAALDKAHVAERAQANATLLSSRFDDYVDQIDRLLATVALAASSSIDDPATMRRLLQEFRGSLPESVDNVALWSLAGYNIAALDGRSISRGVNVSDRSYFRDALARRALALQGPIQSRSTDRTIIQLARPVLDKAGVPVAVISMSTLPDRLLSRLDPHGSIASDSLITVLNEDGKIVARSTDPREWIGRKVADVDSLRSAFRQKSGAREEIGRDGRRSMTGYAIVAGQPWMLTVGEPLERVTAPIDRRLWDNLGIGFVIFGVAMLLAGRLASWTVKPLMRLAADADRLGAGDLAHRSSVATGGEIAALASTFNQMARAIQEREQALAESKAQLRAIVDNLPEQISYIDRDERYRFVNAYDGRFSNFAVDDIVGRTVREVRGDEIHASIAGPLQRALAGEGSVFEGSHVAGDYRHHYRSAFVPDVDTAGIVRGVYVFTQDITERKTAELLRVESEKRLVTITDNLPAMICYVDSTRRFCFANRAFEKWFERPLAGIVGQRFDDLMAADLAEQFDGPFARGMLGEVLECEFEVPSREGGPRWLRCNLIPDVDAGTGEVLGIYGMIHNVTAAKRTEQRLIRLAQYDTLTGLANRHQFNETLARVLALHDQTPAPLALMFLDIDHFKQVNDRFGHGGGDALLKEFADRLTQCVRPTDAVARLAGDEFVVLLEGLHSDEESQFIARKIIATVEKPFAIDGRYMQVSSSIGIAMRSGPGEAASALMNRADEALYEAKRAGRNTFRMAS